MQFAPFALSLGVAVVLVACTGSTDPRTATLFDNIANFSSGEYDRQITSKQGQAATLARSNAAQRQQVAALEQQRARNAGEIAALRGEIATARQQASQARAQLAGNAGQLARLQRLEAQIESVEADTRGGANPAMLRSEIKRITDAIRALSS